MIKGFIKVIKILERQAGVPPPAFPP